MNSSLIEPHEPPPDDAGQRPASSAVAAHAISNTLLRTGDNGGASDG